MTHRGKQKPNGNGSGRKRRVFRQTFLGFRFQLQPSGCDQTRLLNRPNGLGFHVLSGDNDEGWLATFREGGHDARNVFFIFIIFFFKEKRAHCRAIVPSMASRMG